VECKADFVLEVVAYVADAKAEVIVLGNTRPELLPVLQTRTSVTKKFRKAESSI
jgi:hypothetical protein